MSEKSPLTSYRDTLTIKKVIANPELYMDPRDTPFVDFLGGLDGAAGKFQWKNLKSTKMEWFMDTLAPTAGLVSLAATIASTATGITVTDGNYLIPGKIIRVASEDMYVTAVTASTGAVTVVRGYGGTTAVTMAATTFAYSIVGHARMEGADASYEGTTTVTSDYNYTNIFQAGFKITGTESALERDGITDEETYQAGKKMPQLMREVEQMIQNGYRAAEVEGTTPRSAGGYRTFLTANLADGSSLTAAKIKAAMKLVFEDGGASELTAIVSPDNMDKINLLYDTSTFVRYTPEQNQFGIEVERVRTTYGDITFLKDRWQSSSYIPLIDPRHAGLATLRPFFVKDLPASGDYTARELIGELTLCIREPNAHALLTAVS